MSLHNLAYLEECFHSAMEDEDSADGYDSMLEDIDTRGILL